ncbi:MAG: hypothetical protein ACRD1K_05360, partial [Acidimicrobiales bacterium]
MGVKPWEVVYDEHHINLVADDSAGQLSGFGSSVATSNEFDHDHGLVTRRTVPTRTNATGEAVARFAS